MIWIVTILVTLLFVSWVIYDNAYVKQRKRADSLQCELDEVTERLYGSKQNYEWAKQNRLRPLADREQEIALECAEKGIPRSNKTYPTRFKATRR